MLFNAVLAHGWESFDVEVLEIVEDVSCLDEREAYWIKELNATNSAFGYNILSEPRQGMRGRKHSREAIEKLSAARMGAGNPMYGKRLTKEARAQISARQKGKKRGPNSPESIAKMAASRKGKLLGIPLSKEHRKKISEARIGMKFSASHVENLKASHPGKQIKQIDAKTSRVIAVWRSVSDAARQTGFHKGHIGECAQGKMKTYKGYKWVYEVSGDENTG